MIGTAPGGRISKHARPLVVRRMQPNGQSMLVVAGRYSLTKPRPWTTRATNRWQNKRARRARRVNRLKGA